MEVNIYIDTYHTGHLKKGTGTYAIVLEVMQGQKPVTREYIKRFVDTTKNRIAIHACIIAMEYLNKICDVKLHINSEQLVMQIKDGSLERWITTGKNAKGKPPKNMDLWKELHELILIHNVEFIYAEENPYTLYMKSLIKKFDTSMGYKEDKGNV